MKCFALLVEQCQSRTAGRSCATASLHFWICHKNWVPTTRKIQYRRWQPVYFTHFNVKCQCHGKCVANAGIDLLLLILELHLNFNK